MGATSFPKHKIDIDRLFYFSLMFDLCRFLFLMTFLDVLLVCRVWLFFGRHAQYHWGYSNIVYLSSFYGCANGFNHAVKTLEVCLICAGNEHLTPFGNGCLGVLGVEVRSKTCVLISRFINSILLRKRTFRAIPEYASK